MIHRLQRSYFYAIVVFIFILHTSQCVQRNELSEFVVRNVTVIWQGGGPTCSKCDIGIIAKSFACSSTSWEWNAGDWNNGTQIFADPLDLPSSQYILTQVTLSLYGLFNCIQSSMWQITNFRVYLQGTLLTQQVIDQGRYCSCINCVDVIQTPSMEFLNGWPSYNYQGNNTIRVIVDQNAICLNAITLTMTYSSVKGSDSDTDDKPFNKALLWIIVGAISFLLTIIICLAILIVRRFKQQKGYVPITDPSSSALALGPVLDGNEIVIGNRVGKGSYGEVYKAEWRGINVAVKRLPYALLDNKDFLDDFKREAAIMSTLRHPNTLQFLGTCMMGTDICIVTEYMSKGSLYRLLHDDSFDVTYTLVKKFSLDVAQGMLYLHNLKPHAILHRDLKSHNLLVDEHLRVKISDFGLSKVVEQINGTMTSCGTPAWAAPEVLKNSRYTEKADVYSFGICLWEFWTRKDPYEGMPTFQIIFMVGNQGERPTIPSSCPSEYSQLMRDCWHGDPERRPSFEEIVKRIKELDTENYQYNAFV